MWQTCIDARGLHGLSCRKSAPRQQRHSHMNDIIWRAIKRAQVPAVKEPVVSLVIEDNKRPDGTTLLPWAKPLAWDVTVPDTYKESHIKDTMTSPGLAVSRPSRTAEDGQVLKATQQSARTSSVHLPWRHRERLGHRTRSGDWPTHHTITKDVRETVLLFQRLSMALQQGNAVAFQNTMSTE